MKTFNTKLMLTLVGALALGADSAEANNYGDKEAGYDGTVNTTESGHTWSDIAQIGPYWVRRDGWWQSRRRPSKTVTSPLPGNIVKWMRTLL
jgi:hypothetical protein